MGYRLAIFDSDGTLADTLPWLRSIFNELADEFGFRRVGDHEMEQFRQLNGADLLRALELPKWKIPLLMVRMRRRMAAYEGPLHPFPGIPEVLRELKAAGMCLAVVSSNSRANVERVLGPGTASMIAHWNCGASLFGKASKIRSVVKASGVPASHAIYLGDELRDGEAARAAGIAFGAVGWGMQSLDILDAADPSLRFHSVAELARKLLGGSPACTVS